MANNRPWEIADLERDYPEIRSGLGARLSRNSQHKSSQIQMSSDRAWESIALKAAGCERIYSEKMSGKSTSGRRQFEKLMKELLPGDVVVVTKLDRLARSSRDLRCRSASP